MALHRIARGHIPFTDLNSYTENGFLRVGPEIKEHDPYNRDVSHPHVWLQVCVEESEIAYDRLARMNHHSSGEYPVFFRGLVNIGEREFETEGLHFRSGYYAGSIVLPSVIELSVELLRAVENTYDRP